jgi:hypothetical protein
MAAAQATGGRRIADFTKALRDRLDRLRDVATVTGEAPARN